MLRHSLTAIVALSVGLQVPLMAQGSTTSSPIELARQASALKPGQWVWAPEIAPAGPVAVYVDLSKQIATVYRNGVRIAVSTVSTGKPGHETPDGVFVILQKDANHHSAKYNDAPMPFQERLTWDGVALHAGGLPGYPESHGCVHLPLEFSKLLFGITQMGGTVVIAGRAGEPSLTHSAGVLDPIDAANGGSVHVPLPPGEDFRWDPAVSPTGPLTIILSRSDQRAVVLRNGKEIGRARISLPEGDLQTEVLTLARGASGAPRWVVMGVPGHGGSNGTPVDPGILSEARFPKEFLASLRGALQPGSTILVTQAPVLPQTTGQALTVMASSQ
jgi:hypothetical protein